MTFEQLGVDSNIQILLNLNLDYHSLKNICRSNRYFRQICTTEYFWQKKYEKDFGMYFAEVKSWYQLYKYKYASLNEKTVFSLVQSTSNEAECTGSENLISVMAKSEEQFIEFLVVMYNDPQPNKIQKTLIPLINMSTKIINAKKLRKNYRKEIENMIKEWIQLNPNIMYNHKNIRTNDYYIFTDIVYNYYLTPLLLLESYMDLEDKKIVLDLFDFLLHEKKFLENDVETISPDDINLVLESNPIVADDYQVEDEPIDKYYVTITLDYMKKVLKNIKSFEDKRYFTHYNISKTKIYAI